MIPADPGGLYALAAKAILSTPDGLIPYGEVEDATQEAITWLLESPGRCWVRDIDGCLEDPEAQLVADLVAHLGEAYP